MKKLITMSSIIAVMVIGVVFGVQNANANPLSTVPTFQTATATTSIAYLTAGLATTTLYMDAYANGVPRLTDRAALLVQLIGSTTASVLNINLEYADAGLNGIDCTVIPTACDWYQDGGSFTSSYATTTKPFDIGQVNKFVYGFNQSLAGLDAGNAATSTRLVMINTPLRYTRAIFTLPIGSAAASVWAKFVPQRQSI